MKLLRLLVLLLVSLAVPAYGWAGLRPTAPCPMEMAPQAEMHAQADAHEAHCPPDMDCCGDPLAAHCQAGQDCHPATVLAAQSEAGLPVAHTQRGVVGPACHGRAGPQAAPPLRPPRTA